MTDEATLTIEVTCEKCKLSPPFGRTGAVFLELAPGNEGTPSYICLKCWLDHDGFDGPPVAVVEQAPATVVIAPPARKGRKSKGSPSP